MASINDTIESLLKSGVRNLTIGLTAEDDTPFVKAQQAITGSPGNHVFTEHQVVGGDIPTMLERLSAQVEHVAKFKPSVATPKTPKIIKP